MTMQSTAKLTNRFRTCPINLARIRLWILVSLICYWMALFVATHIPQTGMPKLPKHSDKAIHFVAYAGLAFLIGLSLSTTRPLSLRHYAFIFAVTSAYGVLDEILQIPVGRHCDTYDLLADVTGSAVGLATLLALRLILRPVCAMR